MNKSFFIKRSNCIIRKFTQKDIDKAYISWFKNKKNFIFSRHKKNKYDIKYFQNYIKHHNKKDCFFLACLDKTSNFKFGTATVYLDRKTLSANIGILIGEHNFRKKGYGKKIIKLIINYLFLTTNIKRIQIGTNIKNKSMVGICNNLKMVQTNIFKKKKNTYASFSLLKNKNVNFIGIILNDFGAANQVLSYINNNSQNYYFFLIKNPSLRKYMSQNKFFFTKSIDYLISVSDYLIIGTGTTNFEKKHLEYARKRKIFSISVVDHFTSLKKRFQLGKKKISPNVIWTFDKYIFNYIKNKIHFKTELRKNYYLTDIKKKYKKLKNPNKVLYICEPYPRDNGQTKTIDFQSLEFFLKNFTKLHYLSKCSVILKVHPKQHPSKFITLIKKIRLDNQIIIETKKSLVECISEANYVFGLTSYAMLLALYLKKKVYHCKLPNQKIELLPTNKIKSFFNELV